MDQTLEQRFHKQNVSRAKKHRQQIKEKLRKQLEVQTYPLISKPLEKFSMIRYHQLFNYHQQINDTICQQNYIEMDEKDLEDLAQDLLFLINQQQFQLKGLIHLPRYQSVYLAGLVSYIWMNIKPQQLVFWIGYMDEETKQMLYLSIQQEQYELWVSYTFLSQQLAEDINLIQCAKLVKDILIMRKNQLRQFVTITLVKNIIKNLEQSFKLIENFQKIDNSMIETSDFSKMIQLLKQLLIISLILIINFYGEQGFASYVKELVDKFYLIHPNKLEMVKENRKEQPSLICILYQSNDTLFWIRECLAHFKPILNDNSILYLLMFGVKHGQRNGKAHLEILLSYIRCYRKYQGLSNNQEIIKQVSQFSESSLKSKIMKILLKNKQMS